MSTSPGKTGHPRILPQLNSSVRHSISTRATPRCTSRRDSATPSIYLSRACPDDIHNTSSTATDGLPLLPHISPGAPKTLLPSKRCTRGTRETPKSLTSMRSGDCMHALAALPIYTIFHPCCLSAVRRSTSSAGCHCPCVRGRSIRPATQRTGSTPCNRTPLHSWRPAADRVFGHQSRYHYISYSGI